ncbi:hypothetical protein MMC07_009514 [Pseudocyphellaria aurata]|nr:hypothetical protein [Pseudocyphellaria aurata]
MATVTVRERRRTYHWPEAQLNFWLLIMIVASATTLGIFAYFITVQHQLKVGIPWIFPYEITVSALALLFLFAMLVLITQRLLLPGIVVLGSFILFVLWLTGLIETSILLYGPKESVSSYCNLIRVSTGESETTLAWLETNSICQAWKAAFAFEIVGTVFFFWMMVMAYQVNRDEYD